MLDQRHAHMGFDNSKFQSILWKCIAKVYGIEK